MPVTTEVPGNLTSDEHASAAEDILTWYTGDMTPGGETAMLLRALTHALLAMVKANDA